MVILKSEKIITDKIGLQEQVRMSLGTKNTPRLLAAAKEFNIGKETLIDFLKGKGFDIDGSKPNAKLSEEMYDALQEEFTQDKLAKRKSDAISLPKGSLMDPFVSEQAAAPAKKEDIPTPVEVVTTIEP